MTMLPSRRKMPTKMLRLRNGLVAFISFSERSTINITSNVTLTRRKKETIMKRKTERGVDRRLYWPGNTSLGISCMLV